MSKQSLLFDVRRFSLEDGDGIRTVVFLKGCPLRCQWCHNPESQSPEKELKYLDHLCVKCGKCQDVCPHKVHRVEGNVHRINFDNCQACGKCVAACSVKALSIVGEEINLDALHETIRKDLPYYRSSNGGLTISGGEPLTNPEITLEIAKRAKQDGIHVALETSGMGKTDALMSLLPFVDTFLYDYKHANAQALIDYTGARLPRIEKHLEMLLEAGKDIVIRAPLIKDVNLDQEHLEKLAELSLKDGIRKVDILPYHAWGEGKYDQISQDSCTANRFEVVEKDDIKLLLQKLLKGREYLNFFLGNEKI